MMARPGRRAASTFTDSDTSSTAPRCRKKRAVFLLRHAISTAGAAPSAQARSALARAWPLNEPLSRLAHRFAMRFARAPHDGRVPYQVAMHHRPYAFSILKCTQSLHHAHHLRRYQPAGTKENALKTAQRQTAQTPPHMHEHLFRVRGGAIRCAGLHSSSHP